MEEDIQSKKTVSGRMIEMKNERATKRERARERERESEREREREHNSVKWSMDRLEQWISIERGIISTS